MFLMPCCGTLASRFFCFASARLSPLCRGFSTPGLGFILAVGLALGLGLAGASEARAAGDSDGSEQLQRQAQRLLQSRVTQWQKQVGLAELRTQVDLKLPSAVARLSACDSGLKIRPAAEDAAPWGQVSLRAECAQPKWQVVLRAQVTVEARLPVLKTAKTRGESIAAADILWQWHRLGASDTHLVTRQAQLQGKQVVRRIRATRPINLRQLQALDWVTAGQGVVIETKSGGFVAQMPGQALQSGGEGEAVRVRNLSSGKVITAYPVAEGVVAPRF